MNRSAAKVDAIFLDFDGVVLDSVMLKERAFREIIERNFPEHVEASMRYFWANGGTSRINKFRWIWTEIVGHPPDENVVARLGREFSERVYDLVVRCAYIKGANRFLERHSATLPCFVISGTPEPELRGIVHDRGMDRYFRGVYGSPPTKVQIGERILAEHSFARERTWFVGDATTDRDAARTLGVRFIGIAGPHLSPYLDGNETMVDDLDGLSALLEAQTVGTGLDG